KPAREEARCKQSWRRPCLGLLLRFLLVEQKPYQTPAALNELPADSTKVVEAQCWACRPAGPGDSNAWRIRRTARRIPQSPDRAMLRDGEQPPACLHQSTRIALRTPGSRIVTP